MTDAGGQPGRPSPAAPGPRESAGDPISGLGDGPLAAGWVGLGAFAAHVFALAPAPYLLDSAELAAASFSLGIAHPPGESFALLVGKLFSFLPLGSVAYRVGLASAVAAALAAGLVYRLSLPLVAALDIGGKVPAWARTGLAAVAGLGFGLCPGVVMSANRPEVYALTTLLVLVALWTAGSGEPRGPALAALALGLAFATHPLVAALCTPGVAVAASGLLWQRRAGSATASPLRLLGISAGTLAIGLSVLVYLPARAFALQGPGTVDADTLVWGDGRTLAGLIWILSGQTFLDKSAFVHSAAAPGSLPFVIIEELGPLLCVFALAAALYGLRVGRARGQTAALLVTFAGAAAGALFAGLDPLNPDIRGYLGPGLAAVAVLGAAGLGPFLSVLPSRWPFLFAGLALLAGGTAWNVLPLADSVDLSRARAADRHAARLLSDAPSRAAVLTSHFETGFLVAYGRTVEGRRPDAAWVHLGFVGNPAYRERARRAHPELVAALVDHGRGRLSRNAFAPAGRPVLFEAETQLGPAVLGALFPDGHLWRLGAPGRPAPPLGAAALAEAATDRQVRGFFGWRVYLDARLACARDLRDVARLRLSELEILLPRDRRGEALATSCLERGEDWVTPPGGAPE